MIATILCLIVAIADGDTLTARCQTEDAAHPYQQVKIRLAAIDAPEKRQPFGNVSRQHLAALCFRVEATITPRSIDRYGRTVADVKCRNQDAATEQVRAGLAWVYPKYARGYQQLYNVQASAEDARRGLWADPDPVPPWQWRSSLRQR